MLTYIKLLFTALFWGGTFIAGRMVALSMGPWSAALLRFVLASLCLILFILYTEGRLPPITRRQIPGLIILGLTGVFAYNAFLFKGLQEVAAGRASLIVATNPAIITLLSVLLYREKVNGVRCLGVVLSICGAIIVISRGDPGSLLNSAVGMGELYIFGCVVSWVIFSLAGKSIMQGMSPLNAILYSSLIGALMLLYPAWQEGLWPTLPHLSLTDWLALFYLGFFGTVLGTVFYYQGIRAIGASRASLFINFVPICAVLLGFLILHEPLTLSLLTGALLVSSGVYLTNSGSLRLKAA